MAKPEIEQTPDPVNPVTAASVASAATKAWPLKLMKWMKRIGGCKPKPPKIPSSWVRAFPGWCNPRLLMEKYQATKNSKVMALLEKNLAGRLAAYPLSRSLYLLRSRHPIDLDAMVTNLTLEEDEQGLSAIVDPIRSRNVMGNCLTEISAVWAYNPNQIRAEKICLERSN